MIVSLSSYLFNYDCSTSARAMLAAMVESNLTSSHTVLRRLLESMLHTQIFGTTKIQRGAGIIRSGAVKHPRKRGGGLDETAKRPEVMSSIS